MSTPDFTPDEKEIIVQRVKQYFRDQLDQDIGGFDAEFLIDFFTGQIGAYFYNRGLHDAQALFARKVDEFSDAVYELEQPVTSLR